MPPHLPLEGTTVHQHLQAMDSLRRQPRIGVKERRMDHDTRMIEVSPVVFQGKFRSFDVSQIIFRHCKGVQEKIELACSFRPGEETGQKGLMEYGALLHSSPIPPHL